MKVSLVGICVKAKIGVINDKAIIAQSQYIFSFWYQLISKSSKTVDIQMLQSQNKTHHSIAEIKNTELVL